MPRNRGGGQGEPVPPPRPEDPCQDPARPDGAGGKGQRELPVMVIHGNLINGVAGSNACVNVDEAGGVQIELIPLPGEFGVAPGFKCPDDDDDDEDDDDGCFDDDDDDDEEDD